MDSSTSRDHAMEVLESRRLSVLGEKRARRSSCDRVLREFGGSLQLTPTSTNLGHISASSATTTVQPGETLWSIYIITDPWYRR
ncbi:hypothetical protein RND71_042439 [Anisodus tanguticus]|uniref:Uncharacterized protein n=1 Tax=Anisodus tanguticus TaxID=243964 RepID=A0AAE1QTQ0_9SOLA|nr:hypothetical protein RND71_042439 [Anisodus tanguticus]